jgi:hypothetical protein
LVAAEVLGGGGGGGGESGEEKKGWERTGGVMEEVVADHGLRLLHQLDSILDSHPSMYN